MPLRWHKRYSFVGLVKAPRRQKRFVPEEILCLYRNTNGIPTIWGSLSCQVPGSLVQAPCTPKYSGLKDVLHICRSTNGIPIILGSLLLRQSE